MRFIGLDPATTTGFVALDENGEVLIAKDLKGEGKGALDTKQLVSLENLLFQHLQPGDEIVIEDAASGTQKGITTGMIHGGLRTMIERKGLSFNTVNPASVKKYVGVTGWTMDGGKNRRLVDKEKKEAMKQAVIQLFDYTHKSDNVNDAYIIARIAWNLYLTREYLTVVDVSKNQKEVIQSILAGTES